MKRRLDCFSPDYATARERFCAAARTAGATLHAIPLDARGPAGEALSIDIAWRGAAAPRRVLLHSSGLHGVEAFAGSAIQLHLLAQPPAIGTADALILVHVLNPHGMAWLRRTNENNVDLNRNFLADGAARPQTPALYRRIDRLLNPPAPPGFDFFYLRALWAALRHGFHPLKQAAAQGQYEFPSGLFYGGSELQPGPRRYLDWLRPRLAGTDSLLALDVHTGLGDFGGETLIAEAGATAPAVLGAALGHELIDPAQEKSAAYTIHGGLGAALPQLLPAVRVDFLLQELGTYPPLTVLHALREENRWHYYGNGSLAHPAKLRLLEALCPAAPGWRRRALAHGTSLAAAAAAWVFRKD